MSGREHTTTRRSHSNGATYEAECGQLHPYPFILFLREPKLVTDSRLMPYVCHDLCLMPYALCLMPYALYLMPASVSFVIASVKSLSVSVSVSFPEFGTFCL